MELSFFARIRDARENISRSYLKKLSQEGRRSEVFIKQCILIADIYLKLLNENDPSFKFYTQTDFPVKGLIRDLLPSFAFIKQKNTKIEHYTCEILKEGMPRYAIRARIQKYIEFFERSDSRTYLYFYCPNQKILDYTRKYSENAANEQQDLEFSFILLSA